ncbi:hypothetical protein FACS1894133_3310 [Clostridia bacterium]|nr:hypothetical protein FACS1894133_3310 [Clostridia bacterium]
MINLIKTGGVQKVICIFVVLAVVVTTFVSNDISVGASSEYLSYAEQIAKNVESIHAAFMLPGFDNNAYQKVKNTFYSEASEATDLSALKIATQKYFVFFKDGHMIHNLDALSLDALTLDADFYYNGNDVYYQNSPVTEIGGVGIQKILAFINEYCYFENQTERQDITVEKIKDCGVLGLLKCDIRNRGTSVVTKDKTFNLNFVQKTYPNPYRDDKIASYKMIGDVFYVDLNSFTVSKEVDDTALAMEKARLNGTKKFIIDVRGNGGGNSNVGEQLLGALGMQVPGYGMYVRDIGSNPATGQKYEPSLSPVVRNNNVNLVVLTDKLSYSSATMLGVWVQDGKLGKVIGDISYNSPSNFGDIKIFNTPFYYAVSCKKFLRPNVNASQDELVPDIRCTADEALDIALTELKTFVKSTDTEFPAGTAAKHISARRSSNVINVKWDNIDYAKYAVYYTYKSNTTGAFAAWTVKSADTNSYSIPASAKGAVYYITILPYADSPRVYGGFSPYTLVRT